MRRKGQRRDRRAGEVAVPGLACRGCKHPHVSRHLECVYLLTGSGMRIAGLPYAAEPGGNAGPQGDL